MNFITSCNFQISVLYTFSCHRQRAEFASAAFMYKVCVLIEILFLKGGFLSAIASIGLLIALAMTPHDGKNQSKRMGKWLFGLSQKGIFFQPKDPTYTTYFYTPHLKKIKFMREPDNTLIYFYFKSIDKRKFDNVVLSLRKTDNCSPSDRVREKNKNCARFWGQIVRGKTPIVRELCGIAQSFDLPNIPWLWARAPWKIHCHVLHRLFFPVI